MWEMKRYILFPNLNGTAAEVYEWMSNSIKHFTGLWLPVRVVIKVN